MPNSVPSDTVVAEEAKRLNDLRKVVEFKVHRLKPDRIRDGHLASARQKIREILDLFEEYGIALKNLLENPDMEQCFRLQYEADKENLENPIDDKEDAVLDKIHEIELAKQPSIVQPGSGGAPLPVGRTGGHVQADGQQAQIVSENLAKATTVAKGTAKYIRLLNLALTTTQDMEEDGLYLENASNEKIQKLMFKIKDYGKNKETIKSLHAEYLEFTAVYKPDPMVHDPDKLEEAVQGALSSICTLVSSLEVQDEDRQLCTTLPRKTEKVKWPSFSGRPGESLFKFKEHFLKAARQNQTNRINLPS